MSELYVVATPIGNLGDISDRALETLKSVDLIAAEDTRHSGRLLKHFGIETPLRAYHDHNEKQQADWLLHQLKQGKKVALISDAGTPLISDPGYQLVRLVRDQGIAVTPIPGPSALVAALCVSGLPADRFVFEGFLPAKSKGRRERLAQLARETRTLVFYESPHRILASLEDMLKEFGSDRGVVLARELTKAYETVHGDTLGSLLKWVAADTHQQLGEMVIIVRGTDPQVEDVDNSESDRVLTLLLEELPVKQAAALAAKITRRHKNELYARALSLKNS